MDTLRGLREHVLRTNCRLKGGGTVSAFTKLYPVMATNRWTMKFG